MNQQSRRTLIAIAIVAILGTGVATSVLRPWHGGEAQANTPAAGTGGGSVGGRQDHHRMG
jgi:type II secretory pathway pseudopilin PulG